MYYDVTNVYGPRRACFNADSVRDNAELGKVLVRIADLARELNEKYSSVLNFSDSLQAKTACFGRGIYSEQSYLELFKMILFSSCESKRGNQAHIEKVRELIVINNEEWLSDFNKKFG